MSNLIDRIKKRIQSKDYHPVCADCCSKHELMEIIDEESAKEEQDVISTELRILKNYIRHMTKTYRLRTDNASVVHDILLSGTLTAGRTSCIAKCRELGIDPYGHDLESEAMK